jgi:hypothetical protein
MDILRHVTFLCLCVFVRGEGEVHCMVHAVRQAQAAGVLAKPQGRHDTMK